VQHATSDQLAVHVAPGITRRVHAVVFNTITISDGISMGNEDEVIRSSPAK